MQALHNRLHSAARFLELSDRGDFSKFANLLSFILSDFTRPNLRGLYRMGYSKAIAKDSLQAIALRLDTNTIITYN